MFLQQDMGTFVLVLCMHRVQPGHLESINDNKSTQRLCFIQLQNVTDFSNYRIRSSQNEILSDYERSLVILLAPLFSSSFILLSFCVEGLKSWGIGWLRDGRLIMCVFIQTGKVCVPCIKSHIRLFLAGNGQAADRRSNDLQHNVFSAYFELRDF